jgi:hypothetical protein
MQSDRVQVQRNTKSHSENELGYPSAIEKRKWGMFEHHVDNLDA